MGINLFASSSSYDDSSSDSKKPDYGKYNIVKIQELNGYLIIKIHYPDFKNFEGNKILVFKNCKIVDLIEQKTIDPHFSDNSNFKSPIARFRPDDEGWDLALKLAIASV